MSVWTWVVVGTGSFVVLSLLVGLAVGAVLGSIGRRISELHETEDWAMAPPTREREEAEAEPQPGAAKELDRVIRLR